MIGIAMLSGWHVHAKGYAHQVKGMAELELSAVWDDDAQRGESWAQSLGVDFSQDLDAVLSRDDVQAVVVCTPTSSHKDVIIAAARAGKHIFTEKVLATTMAEAQAIAQAVEKAGVKLAISLPRRCAPVNLFVKQAVEKGWLGRVTLARARDAHDGVSSGWLPAHFFDKDKCGGGAMMDLGAHPMYLLRWLMGEPISVQSLFTQAMTQAEGIEDNAVSMIEFEGGAIGLSETGFVSGHSPYALELYGTQGSLMVQGNTVRLFRDDGEVAGFITPERLPKPLPSAMEQWVNAIAGRDDEIVFDIQAALDLTQLMQGAYLSHEQGKRVYFKDL